MKLFLLREQFEEKNLDFISLYQIMELSSIHGPNCLALSSKAKREILSGIQEAVNMAGFSNSAERRCITEIGMKLHQIWGMS